MPPRLLVGARLAAGLLLGCWGQVLARSGRLLPQQLTAGPSVLLVREAHVVSKENGEARGPLPLCWLLLLLAVLGAHQCYTCGHLESPFFACSRIVKCADCL